MSQVYRARRHIGVRDGQHRAKPLRWRRFWARVGDVMAWASLVLGLLCFCAVMGITFAIIAGVL